MQISSGFPVFGQSKFIAEICSFREMEQLFFLDLPHQTFRNEGYLGTIQPFHYIDDIVTLSYKL